jgi:hypothetical protein
MNKWMEKTAKRKIYFLHSPWESTRMINKEDEMRWWMLCPSMQNINRKTEENELLRILTRRWKGNIKIDLTKSWYLDTNWVHPAQCSVAAGIYENSKECLSSIIVSQFLVHITDFGVSRRTVLHAAGASRTSQQIHLHESCSFSVLNTFEHQCG